MLVIAITLAQAHRLENERLRRAVNRAVGEAVDATTPTAVRHDDRERMRGLPALVRGGLSSAIRGTEPGSDEHLERLE
jgi:hypothetical protein